MLAYWIWLESRKGLNHRQKLALAECFPDLSELWEAEAESLEGLSPGALESLADKSLDRAWRILEDCDRLGIRVLTAGDGQYPNRLRSIGDPPAVLYYKGSLPDFDREAAIGVVGTRKASAYGLMAAEKLARQIASHGGLVVSGMAAGIDAQAGWGAIHAGAPTVGVLGGGVDHIYPAANRELYAVVEQQGCLLSEYPPGTKPTKWTFPQRNRIVSGLSCGVLVVEAPEKSGTMITARDARIQGRDLYVVPGHIDSVFCAGSNALLKDGARLATCGWDVLESYEAQFPDKLRKEAVTRAEPRVLPSPPRVTPKQTAPKAEKTKPAPKAEKTKAAPKAKETKPAPAALGSTAEEQTLLNCLAEGEMTVDVLIRASGLETQKALATLTMLEIKGMVTTLPGRRVIRNS